MIQRNGVAKSVEQETKQGIFKKELKNRFLCLVEVDGADTLCYIPSSCRISNFINLTDKPVLLQRVKTNGSRTKFSVFALCNRDKFILLNMSRANAVVERSIRNRRFSDLGSRSHVRKEYTIEGYKCDLYIEDTKTIVEIKSILSFEDKARFPSVYSQRAIDQLSKINLLLDKGYRVCYLFVSLNPKVKRIVLNTDDVEFQNAFELCIGKGMMVKGISLNMENGEPYIFSSVDIYDNT